MIIELDDKLKRWIETNRIKWIFILFSIGILIGIFGNMYVGGTLRQGAIMSLTYSIFLVVTEIFAGGSAIN